VVQKEFTDIFRRCKPTVPLASKLAAGMWPGSSCRVAFGISGHHTSVEKRRDGRAVERKEQLCEYNTIIEPNTMNSINPTSHVGIAVFFFSRSAFRRSFSSSLMRRGGWRARARIIDTGLAGMILELWVTTTYPDGTTVNVVKEKKLTAACITVWETGTGEKYESNATICETNYSDRFRCVARNLRRSNQSAFSRARAAISPSNSGWRRTCLAGSTRKYK